MVIDKSFTNNIRASAETTGYEGSLFTNEEVEALFGFSKSAGKNPDFTTKLTEELFERTTGMKVDLSRMGPASDFIFNATTSDAPRQEHAAYRVTTKPTVSVSGIKFTPQDVNKPVLSLDFAKSNAPKTPLDAIILDKQENPIEKALLKQLRVVQSLSVFGAEVGDLTNVISQVWGIDYVADLLDKVGFADIQNVDSFVAAGGRPAPMSYLCVNTTSKYTMSAKPTMTDDQIGGFATFWGRGTVLAKHTASLTNLARGDGSFYSESYLLNPGHIGYDFKPELSRSVFRVPLNFRAKRTLMRSWIPNIDTLEVFVNARTSGLQEYTRINKSISLEFEKVSRPSRSVSYILSRVPTNNRTFPILGHPAERRTRNVELRPESMPSKTVALLFSGIHGDRTANKYDMVCSGVVFSMTALATKASHKVLIELRSLMDKDPGLYTMKKSINIEKAARSNEDIEKLISATEHERLATWLYLWARFCSLGKVNFGSSKDMVIKWIRTGSAPNDMKARKLDGINVKIGSIHRTYKMLCCVLSRCKGMRPFTYMSGYDKIMSRNLLAGGVSRLALRSVSGLAEDYDAWVSSIKVKKGKRRAMGHEKLRYVDTIKRAARKSKVIVSEIRKVWMEFYTSKAKRFEKNAKMVGCDMESYSAYDCVGPEPKETEISAKELVYSGMLVECAHNWGTVLAFQFYQIIWPKAIDNEDPVKALENYFVDLCNSGWEAMSKSFKVDSKAEALDSNSALSAAVDEAVIRISNCFDRAIDAKRLAEFIVNSSYRSSVTKVVWSIQTACKMDYSEMGFEDTEAIVPETAKDVDPETSLDVRGVFMDEPYVEKAPLSDKVRDVLYYVSMWAESISDREYGDELIMSLNDAEKDTAIIDEAWVSMSNLSKAVRHAGEEVELCDKLFHTRAVRDLASQILLAAGRGDNTTDIMS